MKTNLKILAIAVLSATAGNILKGTEPFLTYSARRPVGGYLVILQMSAQHEKSCRTNVQTS